LSARVSLHYTTPFTCSPVFCLQSALYLSATPLFALLGLAILFTVFVTSYCKTLFFSAALRPRGSCTGGVLYRLTPIFCYRVTCKISVEITVLLGRPPQRACVRVRLSVVIFPGRLSCIMLLKEGRASLDGLDFSGWAWLISCHFYLFIERRVKTREDRTALSGIDGSSAKGRPTNRTLMVSRRYVQHRDPRGWGFRAPFSC